jgi:hypothetical protein
MRINGKTFRQIALPIEHGSWGFVLEPLALALIVAYSPAGLFLSISAFFIFLAHQPVRALFNEKFSHVRLLSGLVLSLYGIVALASLFASFSRGSSAAFLPFGFAIFLMTAFLITELFKTKQGLWASVIAPVSVDLIAISVILLGNWAITKALLFFVLLLARSVQTTFYIHEKLQKLKGKKYTSLYVHLTGFFFLVFGLSAYALNSFPLLPSFAILILVLRAARGLSKNAPKTTVRKIGINEFIYGILFVAISALGFLMGI